LLGTIAAGLAGIGSLNPVSLLLGGVIVYLLYDRLTILRKLDRQSAKLDRVTYDYMSGRATTAQSIVDMVRVMQQLRDRF
jgi:hypothetical protein